MKKLIFLLLTLLTVSTSYSNETCFLVLESSYAKGYFGGKIGSVGYTYFIKDLNERNYLEADNTSIARQIIHALEMEQGEFRYLNRHNKKEIEVCFKNLTYIYKKNKNTGKLEEELDTYIGKLRITVRDKD